MKIGEYKQMMAYLTRPKNKDPIKESLKKLASTLPTTKG